MIAVPFVDPRFGSCVKLQGADGSQATVALQGAHVLSWISADGSQGLFMSSLASTPGAIRGGIPVCFPQFASMGDLPKHGYARTSAWRHSGGGRFVLDVPPGLWAGFPFPCVLMIEVTLGPGTLAVTLTVENIGPEVFCFTGALHTYLSVDDVRKVRVDGLDHTQAGGPAAQLPGGLSFGSEVDLNFAKISRPLVVSVAGEPTMLCAQTGFADAVVWNIGPDAAESIADLGKGEWVNYVCVEAAVLTAYSVQPGSRWTGTQILVDLTG